MKVTGGVIKITWWLSSREVLKGSWKGKWNPNRLAEKAALYNGDNRRQGSTEWYPAEIFPLSNCHNANLIWAKALQIQKRKNKTKHIILEYILSHHWTSTHPRVNMSTEVTDVSQPQQWRFNWPSWLWSTNGVKLNASQNQTHPVFNTWAVSNISHSFTLHYSLYMELGRLDYLVDSLINWNPLRDYTIQLEKIGMRLYWLKYSICTVDISL